MTQPATIQAQREQVARVAQQRHEAFEAHRHEQLVRNELTDVSERFGAPVGNRFVYRLVGDDLVSDLNESLGRAVYNGRDNAARMAWVDHDWQDELLRCEIACEEYTDTIELARRGEGARVRFWLVPDRVRSGESRISGYNRDRLMMFVRTAAALGDGKVEIYSGSCDLSDYEGVQAMAQVIGHDLPLGLSSETVASKGFDIDSLQLAHIHSVYGHGDTGDSPAKSVNTLLRAVYDSVLHKKYGGEWYAGQPAEEVKTKDALAFAKEHPDLLRQHLNRIESLVDPGERERARYDYAAGIRARLEGAEQVDLVEAGDAARAQGLNLSGDCPTAPDAENAICEVHIEHSPCCDSSVTFVISPLGTRCTGCGASRDTSGNITYPPGHPKNPEQLAKVTTQRKIRLGREALKRPSAGSRPRSPRPAGHSRPATKTKKYVLGGVELVPAA